MKRTLYTYFVVGLALVLGMSVQSMNFFKSKKNSVDHNDIQELKRQILRDAQEYYRSIFSVNQLKDYLLATVDMYQNLRMSQENQNYMRAAQELLRDIRVVQ